MTDIYCDNDKCKYNGNNKCNRVDMRYINRLCMSYEHKDYQTDINHEPVIYRNRNIVFK